MTEGPDITMGVSGASHLDDAEPMAPRHHRWTRWGPVVTSVAARNMHARSRRLAMAFFLAAVPLGIASAAFACQSLATLHANPGTAAVGVQTMTLIGNGFDPGGSSIEIHLDSRTGPLLRAVDGDPVLVDRFGNLSVTLAMPSGVSVGYHFFIATQTDSLGRLTAGTPVRASFQILPASASSSAAPFGPGHPHEQGHPNTTRSSVVDLVTLASPLGIAPLAASGAICLVLRRRRSRRL